MKRRVRALIIAVAVAIGALAFRGDSQAAGMLGFTAVTDTLMPLRSGTLPTYFGSVLYVPYNIFSYAGVYNTRSTVDNVACLYNGRSRLDFYIGSATYDQDGKFFDGVIARYSGSVIFVPINFVCEFFGLMYTVTPQEPASILRITSSDAVYSDKTFANRFRSQMRESYEEYTGARETPPAATPTQTPPESGLTPTPTPVPTDEDITLYLLFYDLGGGAADSILDALDVSGYRGCFFVTEEEAARYPDIVRRAVGSGHAMGVLLGDGGYSEYAGTSELLFEAAKVKTVLVAADTAESVDNGLVYWCAIDASPDEVPADPRDDTVSLPTSSGARQNVALPCSEAGALASRSLLARIDEYKYTVVKPAETAVPPV
ncbi:MAG: hypothetical protein LBJ99_04755 [Oscillospiraceae bacterium]|jgi:hypothetical protein|nr:hypothetical protein [Oscillospiraceae bacterium]